MLAASESCLAVTDVVGRQMQCEMVPQLWCCAGCVVCRVLESCPWSCPVSHTRTRVHCAVKAEGEVSPLDLQCSTLLYVTLSKRACRVVSRAEP